MLSPEIHNTIYYCGECIHTENPREVRANNNTRVQSVVTCTIKDNQFLSGNLFVHRVRRLRSLACPLFEPKIQRCGDCKFSSSIRKARTGRHQGTRDVTTCEVPDNPHISPVPYEKRVRSPRSLSCPLFKFRGIT